jgi:hypothetical protein
MAWSYCLTSSHGGNHTTLFSKKVHMYVQDANINYIAVKISGRDLVFGPAFGNR